MMKKIKILLYLIEKMEKGIEEFLEGYFLGFNLFNYLIL